MTAVAFSFGRSLGGTPRGELVSSQMSATCVVVGVLFGMIAAKLFKERRWLASIVPTLFFIASAGWSVLSMTGFIAKGMALPTTGGLDTLDQIRLGLVVYLSVLVVGVQQALFVASTYFLRSAPATVEPKRDGSVDRPALLGETITDPPARPDGPKAVPALIGRDDTVGTQPVPQPQLRNETIGSSLRIALGKDGRVTREKALKDVLELIAQGGAIPSQKFCVKRWNTPKQTVSRWFCEWDRDSLIARTRSGPCNEIRAVCLAAA